MKNRFFINKNQLTNYFLFNILFLSICSCKTNYYESFNKSKNVVNNSYRGSFNPPGMVYIPSGVIEYKPDPDREARKVSVSAFYIDETEVTNRQYRFFTDWVADSIAVTDYLKDDKYFISSFQKKSRPTDTLIKRAINWEAVFRDAPLWKSKKSEVVEKLAPMLISNGAKTELNKNVIKYRFTYIKLGSTNKPVTVTELIPVFPKENVWSSDFPNAQMEVMDLNYFIDKSYNEYPAVGVTWKQARAYSDWRGKCVPFILKSNPYLPKRNTSVNLPTEAQWQLAATGSNLSTLSDERYFLLDKKENKQKFSVNFKQAEGDYSQDGGTMTLPVKSYSRNRNGLFNLEGNVSEWTLDAYSPSSLDLVNDLNPYLKYDAEETESDFMKRKVVRGGSWKDNALQVSGKTRNYDLQNASHSYLGFRCVIPAFELPSDQVKTRTKK